MLYPILSIIAYFAAEYKEELENSLKGRAGVGMPPFRDIHNPARYAVILHFSPFILQFSGAPKRKPGGRPRQAYAYTMPWAIMASATFINPAMFAPTT